jgi:hypothetical protein
MALVAQSSKELVALFDREVQEKTRQIYQAIPGTMIKFLEKKEIVKKVTFRADFAADQVAMGTKKQVNFVDFEKALRNTIHQKFVESKVTEVRAEDLSAEISERYKKEIPSRPDAGKSVSIIIKFNKDFQKKEGDFWAVVNAYVYVYIVEECENNWFAQDKRKFNYELTIELNGITVNKDKAIKFAEMIKKTEVQQAIKELEQQCPLTWGDI